jgi:hypothetical protein
MAYTTVNKSTDYFNTLIYSGTGGNGTTTTQAITGAGFQPDWVWLKQRSSTQRHQICDVVRGANNIIGTDRDGAAVADTEIINSFDSDGFTAGYQDQANDTGQTYVSWLWRAGNSQGSSNTDGSINTTYTSVNTTAGFSISTYTGTGSNATIGHGLGVKPSMIICKKLNTTGSWITYHSALGATKYLYLNATDAQASNSTVWQDTEPTTSVFSVGSASNCNASGATYVAYCFAEKTGYSKFGSYTGNGSNSFIYTGFKPALMICKKTDSADNWKIVDNKRSPFNVMDDTLAADTNNAEASPEGGVTIDFLSNGFAFKSMSNAAFNANGGSYIYMAFAEVPLVGSNNIPATAR